MGTEFQMMEIKILRVLGNVFDAALSDIIDTVAKDLRVGYAYSNNYGSLTKIAHNRMMDAGFEIKKETFRVSLLMLTRKHFTTLKKEFDDFIRTNCDEVIILFGNKTYSGLMSIDEPAVAGYVKRIFGAAGFSVSKCFVYGDEELDGLASVIYASL